MKLGVSYNLFDGEELLLGSINCIRQDVDFISVVYQSISNYGYAISNKTIELLQDLQQNKLIDSIQEYRPQTKGGAENEINKRNIGLLLSYQNGCSHHMSMDTDEYYLRSEFRYLKETVIKNDNDASYCQMMSYYKTWEYCLDPPEDHYVSLIFKIKDNSRFGHNISCPVIVDPTRNMNDVNNAIIFNRQQIQMHHGSYIRNDIRLKLINSSAQENFVKDIPKLINYYNEWTYPKPALWAGRPSKLLNLKKVPNVFFNK